MRDVRCLVHHGRVAFGFGNKRGATSARIVARLPSGFLRRAIPQDCHVAVFNST
jgi:hypothetical protein